MGYINELGCQESDPSIGRLRSLHHCNFIHLDLEGQFCVDNIRRATLACPESYESYASRPRPFARTVTGTSIERFPNMH